MPELLKLRSWHYLFRVGFAFAAILAVCGSSVLHAEEDECWEVA